MEMEKPVDFKSDLLRLLHLAEAIIQSDLYLSHLYIWVADG